MTARKTNEGATRLRKQPVPWAIALREARERTGLSQRQMSIRLGVAQETVRAAELGRPARHSTLMKYLELLPGLRANDLLHGSPAPPAASAPAWRRYAEVFGFSAKEIRCTRTVSASGAFRDQVVIDGVRSAHLDLGDPRVQLDLMQATCLGEPGLRRALEVTRALTSVKGAMFRHGGQKHVFGLRGSGARRELWYRFEGRFENPSSVEFAVDLVAARLSFEWKARGVLAATAHARPEPIPKDDADPMLLQRMHPAHERPVARDGSIRWSIDHPMPGFAYGMSVAPAKRPVRPKAWSLATTLREARTRHGLTMRDVAAIAGTSAASLAYAEHGRDPRASTLTGYLRAMPSLAPQDILPGVAKNGVLDSRELWTLMRDLYGYEIDDVRKELVIKPDGRSTAFIDWDGLRPLRGDLRDFRVRTGLHRTISQVDESVLEEIESSVAGTSVRRVKRQEGPVVHEFRFPRRLGTGSLAYRRTYAGASFPVSRATSRKAVPEGSRLVSGCALPIYHPVRRAIVCVRLPHPIETDAVQARVFVSCTSEALGLPPYSPELVPPHVRIESKGSGRLLTLTMHHPLIGTTYAITWSVM